MKSIALVAFLSITAMPIAAAAQQSYSFEDACRMAGRTTGPCAPKSKQEPTLDCRKIASNAFHPDKVTGDVCRKVTLSPVLDVELLVEMVGLPNVSKLNELKLTIGRSVGSKNAIATYYNNERIIILDPDWVKNAKSEAYLVLGHEAGHHFCNHPLDGEPLGRKKRELEADRFSGAAIKRFEEYHGQAFLQNAIAAAERIYSSPETSAYPSLGTRLEAINVGYKIGSPCGGLAAGVRGYTAGPR